MTTLREAAQQAQAKQIRKAYDLLVDFLQDHPLDDQADLRVFDAAELLEHALAEPEAEIFYCPTCGEEDGGTTCGVTNCGLK